MRFLLVLLMIGIDDYGFDPYGLFPFVGKERGGSNE
jgi:hypothetical protein